MKPSVEAVLVAIHGNDREELFSAVVAGVARSGHTATPRYGPCYVKGRPLARAQRVVLVGPLPVALADYKALGVPVLELAFDAPASRYYDGEVLRRWIDGSAEGTAESAKEIRSVDPAPVTISGAEVLVDSSEPLRARLVSGLGDAAVDALKAYDARIETVGDVRALTPEQAEKIGLKPAALTVVLEMIGGRL